MIITRGVVLLAVQMLRPIAEGSKESPGLLSDPTTSWGPKHVDGVVTAPGLEEEIWFEFGEFPIIWDPNWGDEDPRNATIDIARGKHDLAAKYHMPTSKIAAEFPWLIENGKYLYPGGDYFEGIAVGVSGIMGRADEALAAMLIELIVMLARLNADNRIKNHQMRIT